VGDSLTSSQFAAVVVWANREYPSLLWMITAIVGDDVDQVMAWTVETLASGRRADLLPADQFC
jgi:hypothetical protein